MVDQFQSAKGPPTKAEIYEIELVCKPSPPGTPRGGETFSDAVVLEFEMCCRPSPPGTPNGGETCALPYDAIKRLRIRQEP